MPSAIESPLLLPMEVLRELLAFLPLDDRERLAPLNRAFVRILTTNVNAQRKKILTNFDALAAVHWSRLGRDSRGNRLPGCGIYFVQYLVLSRDERRVKTSLNELRERYQHSSEGIDEIWHESTALSTLRRQIAQLESTAELESLKCELRAMEAEELGNLAERALAQAPHCRNGGSDSNGTYSALFELRQICSEMADCHRSLHANALLKHANQVSEMYDRGVCRSSSHEKGALDGQSTVSTANELSLFSGSQSSDVRILLIGDEGVGKTSLILSLLDDKFCDLVPARIETILIPPDVTPDGVITEIIDYSSREQSEEELDALINRSNVIVIVYSVEDQSTADRVTSHWLPLIQSTLGGPSHGKPVLLVANKSDEENDSSHIDKVVPIMNDYLEIETVVECSAKIMKNVSEIFFYAQKAVVYPFRPLFRVEERELSQRCRRALVRIFKISDADNDGLLSDEELRLFQFRCFNVPLTQQAIDEVKQVVLENDSQGVIDNSLTLSGFLFLHQMFIQRGRHETVWIVLKRYGYNLDIQLREDYLRPPLKVPKGSSTEISSAGMEFIVKLFRKYDEDRDECLSPTELQNLFNICPTCPWTKDSLCSVETNPQGWVTLNGYVNAWVMNFTLNITQAMEHLAYLGYNVEHESQLDAVTVTRDRRIDVAEKCTERRVFQCHVIGPKDAGKTCFCHSLVGKGIQEVSQLSRRQLTPYVINSVRVKNEHKHLLLHEVDVYSKNDQLSSYEKSADVICLLYDSTNPNSFAYSASIYLRYFYRTKVPCLLVSTKVDEGYEVEQNYEYQPTDFCMMHQLPKPVRLHSSDIGNAKAVVFSQLATMATYPHLKRVYYLHDSNIPKVTLGAAVVALVGFLIYKNL